MYNTSFSGLKILKHLPTLGKINLQRVNCERGGEVVQSNGEERNIKRASLCYLVMDFLDFISTNCLVYLRCAEFIGANCRKIVCMCRIC